MKSYFDTSALVAVYVSEAHSSSARQEAQAVGQVPFTLLHDLELGNALRLLRGRRLIDDHQLEQLLHQVAEDRDAGRLVETAVDLHRVFERAQELSAACAVRLLCRSLENWSIKKSGRFWLWSWRFVVSSRETSASSRSPRRWALKSSTSKGDDEQGGVHRSHTADSD